MEDNTLTREYFAAHLHNLADAVASGDCLGGHIIFNAFYGVEKDQMEAISVFRADNLNGMGRVETNMLCAPTGILKDFMDIPTDDKEADMFLLSLLPRI